MEKRFPCHRISPFRGHPSAPSHQPTEPPAVAWPRCDCHRLRGQHRLSDRPAPPALATATTSALAFYQVSAGWNHSCGVTTDNRAYCWGATTQGALGDGEPDFPTVPQPTPVAVLGGIQFHQLSAGSFVTCGVTPDFRAYCWGDNERGEVGDGSLTNRLVPVAVAGGLRFRQIETNFAHTCGVSYPDNRAYCWGGTPTASSATAA